MDRKGHVDPSASRRMATCSECGRETEAGWSACPFCGASLAQSETQSGVTFTDSAMSGDVHHTVVHNDPVAVTSAVIAALKELGMVHPVTPQPSPLESPPFEMEIPLPPSFAVGDHVEYHSPTNGRWLDRCVVVACNPDGTYRIEVPYDDLVQTKHAVVIGSSPGTIRPAAPPFVPGDRVMADWRGHGHLFPGRIVREHDNHQFLIHYDDGDVEDHVEWSRLRPLAEEDEQAQSVAQHVTEAEAELIEAFQAFDEDNTGTITAQRLFEILTQMGDDPLDSSEVAALFESMGVDEHAELDYKGLAKWMVGPDAGEFEAQKPKVVLKDAHLDGEVLRGYAYDHPTLGEGPLRTSNVLNITYDARATAHVETQNTVYVVGPTGWTDRPSNHPFNAAHHVNEHVRVEWNGAWYDARIQEVDGERYKITYDGYDASWDEWVTTARMQTS